MDNNQNSDLAGQYQSILDKYAQELAVAPKPAEAELPPPLPETVSTPQPPTNSIFKFIFYISLLIFLGVLVANVYMYFFAKPSVDSVNEPTLTPNPTAIIANYCQLNEVRYVVDQTFPAQDGCNTCTCLADLTISCTNEICPTAGPTKKPVPLTVSSVYPTSGKVDSKITIYGTGFDKTANTVVLTPVDNNSCIFTYKNIASTDGQKIGLSLVNPVISDCTSTTLVGGLYNLSVNGSTKLIKFTVTGVTPTSSISDLKKYENKQYGFSVEYSNNFNMEVSNVETSKRIDLIFDRLSGNSFTIQASMNYPVNQPKYMLDTESVGTKIINNQTWSVFKTSDKYSGLQTVVNSILYSVSYPTSRETEVDKILTTLKFIN